MTPTPTEEIRAIRRELAAKLDNNIRRIGEDIRQRQLASGRTYISLPKRAPQQQTTTKVVAKSA
jgi:hypothetical protein